MPQKQFLRPIIPFMGTLQADIDPPTPGVLYEDLTPPTIGTICGFDVTLNLAEGSTFAYQTVYYAVFAYVTVGGNKYFSSTYNESNISNCCGSFDVQLDITAIPAGATGIRIYRNTSGYWGCADYVDIEATGTIYDNPTSTFNLNGPFPACPYILPYNFPGDISFTEDPLGFYYPVGTTIYYRCYSYKVIGGLKYYSGTTYDTSITIANGCGGSVKVTVNSIPSGADGIAVFQYNSYNCPPETTYVRYFDTTSIFCERYDDYSNMWTAVDESYPYPPALTLPTYTGADTILNNTLYPDTTDGKFKWKNLTGTIKELST